MTYHIEGKLMPDRADSSSDFKADIEFNFIPGAPPLRDPIHGDDAGWDPDIDILAVTPFGVVGPIDEISLLKLANDWLQKDGGHDACCRHVEERQGNQE